MFAKEEESIYCPSARQKYYSSWPISNTLYTLGYF